ncbi:MAG: hypothetical protein ABS79_02465 [Planctomycetes bacterium SCN 63-9]|nr:MAG: hypothetical protein ABS79_02465 [Planctomycetes bacterium SCN 63-9]
MTHTLPPRTRSTPGYFGFKVIGAFKLASGVVLLALGFGLFRLVDHNHGEGWDRLIRLLQLDAHSRLFRSAIEAISGIDRAHLHVIEAGTFFYAILHLIEGFGLVFERDWAGYVVIVITGSLIPFELYEVAREPSMIRAGVLFLNAAILVYLVVELIRERRQREQAVDAGTAPPARA